MNLKHCVCTDKQIIASAVQQEVITKLTPNNKGKRNIFFTFLYEFCSPVKNFKNNSNYQTLLFVQRSSFALLLEGEATLFVLQIWH